MAATIEQLTNRYREQTNAQAHKTWTVQESRPTLCPLVNYRCADNSYGIQAYYNNHFKCERKSIGRAYRVYRRLTRLHA